MPDRPDLNRLVDRMVDRRAYADDPTYHAMVAHLRHLMGLTEAAMRDEGVEPDVARRVLERMTYGTPGPYEAYQRARDIVHPRLPAWAASVEVVTDPPGVSPDIVDCSSCLALIDAPCAGLLAGTWHAPRVEAAKRVLDLVDRRRAGLADA